MLDSDMVFPADTLLRLLNPCLMDNRDAVGAVYCTRRGSFCSTGMRDEGKHLILHPRRDKGQIPVHSLGLGVFLVRCSSVAKLPKPWFNFSYDESKPHADRWTGEDFWFCDLLRASGVQIFCDADLSREVQHIGETEYKTQDIRK